MSLNEDSKAMEAEEKVKQAILVGLDPPNQDPSTILQIKIETKDGEPENQVAV